MTRPSVVRAVDHLAARDPVVAELVARHGPPRLARPVPVRTRFAVLARSIVYQQLASPAANAIHGRLVTALGGAVTPEAVLAATPDLLAGCGLSRAKATALVDLADQVATGQISLERVGRLPDAEVVSLLVQVRGVGVWTAEMFLLSSLGRLDVWPVGDLGVRTGYAAAWGMAAPPSPKELIVLGERFRPYRSVVAWYCWRAADGRQVPPTPPAADPGEPRGRTRRRTVPAVPE